MNNIWILAVAEVDETQSQEGAVITSQEMDSASTDTTTQTDAGDGTEGQTAPPPPKLNLMSMLPFVLIFVVMYFLLFRGPKKKQAEHQKMVKSLNKNDRVRTIGGIFGVVIDVKDDEITLKVDESNNTKIKISPAAIGTVLSGDEK